MKVLISGATGFIGRHLAQRLLRDGHEVTAWVRDRLRAEKTLGTEIQVIEGARGYQLPAEKLEAFDAVINLAGESIVGGRWTGAKKKRILESRVRTTQALVKAINECKNPPKVFFSASATGFYGHGDAQSPFDENCNAGNDFLAQVSEQWESAAKEVNTDTRLVIGRISLVLGLEEGLLGKLTPLFDAGLGGFHLRFGRPDFSCKLHHVDGCLGILDVLLGSCELFDEGRGGLLVESDLQGLES